MILFITRKYPPSIGGMQKFSYNLTVEMAKLTNVITIAWGYSQVFLPIFVFYAFLKAIIAILRNEVELIHIGDAALSPLGLTLNTLFGLPVVVTVHGLDIVFPNRLYQLIIPRCLIKLDLLICVSKKVKEECLKRGISAKRCRVIPNGVNIIEMDPIAPMEKARLRNSLIDESLNEAKILLTVGRLVRRKGITNFIERVLPIIINKRSDIHYLIVGRGNQHRLIEKQIQRLGLRKHVSLLGQVDDKTLNNIYRIADIFVMPNIPVEGDIEGFGIVALEACAAGLCVVASNLEGLQEAVIRGDNGFLVEPDDIHGYVNIILELLDSDLKRKKFGDKAREFTKKNYLWANIARRYYEAFKELGGV